MKKTILPFSILMVCMGIPGAAFAMHITEGIITGVPALAYTAVGLVLVGWGAWKMKLFIEKYPDKKPLLGMGGALIFLFSLIPIPAFTGTCSHPCGSPLVAILLGPSIAIGLTALSLLMQAAFFAHGGFATWGANVLGLGFLGCVTGWGSFRLARKMNLPLLVSGFIGGFVGDVMTYVGAGFFLGSTLAYGPTAQYSMTGYLIAIYGAYIPTQFPIAVGEMLLTGYALKFAYERRPEVLYSLGILKPKPVPVRADSKKSAPVNISIVFLMILGALMMFPGINHATEGAEEAEPLASFSGMDEAVNEHMAENAGLPPRDPYINLEDKGDLWNLFLLGGGSLCGFVIGRWWHLLFQSKEQDQEQKPSGVKGRPVET
ncbi:MAG: hypothetical protein GY737_24985 [Desulfobacteraceae bacterium]|nr:hypothetical protein [Desulfobacteraceae bacterium]